MDLIISSSSCHQKGAGYYSLVGQLIFNRSEPSDKNLVLGFFIGLAPSDQRRRRSVRTVPAGANVIAVGVVAAAAVGPGCSGSDRSGAHRSRHAIHQAELHRKGLILFVSDGKNCERFLLPSEFADGSAPLPAVRHENSREVLTGPS